MASEPRKPTRSKREAANATPPTPRPFDNWLHKQLHAMYDEIAKEPLPDDLLRLIDSDERGASPGRPSSDKDTLS